MINGSTAQASSDVLSITNFRHGKDSFDLRWQVTSLCNYSCVFCIQGSREAKAQAARTESREIRTEVLEGVVHLLENQLFMWPRIRLHLIGGEVTVLPDFLDIVQRLVECDYPGKLSIHVTTNLSPTQERLLQLCDLFRDDNRSLSLSASYYSSFTTEDEFFGKIGGLARATGSVRLGGGVIHSLGTVGQFLGAILWSHQRVQLSVGYPILTDEDYQDLLRLRHKYGKFLRSIRPIPIREHPTSLSKKTRTALQSAQGGDLRVEFRNGTTRLYQGIQQLGLEVGADDRFCPEGMTCDAGLVCASVYTDGTVMRCPVLDAPDDFRLGNVSDSNLTLPTEPQACTADHCSCNYFREIKRQTILSHQPTRW